MIKGDTNYHIIHDMWNFLYGNTHNLTTTLRKGNHGHIRIVTRETLYATILPTPYTVPVYPGGTAHITAQATMAVISQLRDEHAEDRCIHKNNHNMDTALKSMVLEGVQITYIFALHNIFTGYMGSLTK